MAWVDAETVTSLIEAHGEDRGSVLRPAFGGEAGWPVLLPVAHLRGAPGPAGDRMPDELVEDLAAAGVPVRASTPAIPASPTTSRRPARTCRPTTARRSPPTPTPTNGARPAADDPDDAPVPGPARLAPVDRAASNGASHGRIHRPRRRTVGLVLLAVVALLAVGWLWYTQPQPLLPEATAALASTPEVTFAEVDGRLDWSPADGDYDTGLILYPGGKVPAAGYGPLARAIAGDGYLVVIMSMPFNLAVFGIDAAGPAIAAHPEIDCLGPRRPLARRVDGGAVHRRSPGETRRARALGLVPGDGPLRAGPRAWSRSTGRLTPVRPGCPGPEAQAMLPPDTVFVPIDGGNHEQMGWYTGQPNDPPATIARAEQQRQVAQATVAMLETIAPPAP